MISRRGFLGILGGAAATAIVPGAVAEALDFLRRKPVSVMAPATGWPVSDADWLESRRYFREEICRVFQVPPHMAFPSDGGYLVPKDFARDLQRAQMQFARKIDGLSAALMAAGRSQTRFNR